MVLVSGRPISFQMDLYTPLYVQRPTVVPELFQGLRPVAYSGRMDEVPLTYALDAISDMDEGGQPQQKGKSRFQLKKSINKRSDPQAKLAGGGPGRDGWADESRRKQKEKLDLAQSVSSVATAAKLGDFFQYTIDRPVSLPRQKSADRKSVV